MSKVLIQNYLADLAKLRQVGGTHRESVVREAFKDLLKGWARAHDLTFVPEYEIESPAKERRYVDGALLYGLACRSATGKPKTKRTTSMPRSKPSSSAAIRPTTSSLRIRVQRC
jgi:hypothetical protein